MLVSIVVAERTENPMEWGIDLGTAEVANMVEEW
jgi:hypothetical protein